jgi:hypothetical protein
VLGGWAPLLVGILVAALMYRHPEGQRAPAWVGDAACGAFAFGAMAIVAAQSRYARAQAWLGVAAVASLLTPGAWIAFGPGPRECTVVLPFASAAGSELVCRRAFGLGAVLVAAFLVWLVKRALRSANAG